MNKEKLKGYLDKVKTALGKVSKKIWILLAVIVVVAVAAVILLYNNRPYAVLIDGASSEETATVMNWLAGQGVTDYRMEGTGTILVPRSQAAVLKANLLQEQYSTNNASFSGYFERVGALSTQYDRRVARLASLIEELESTIRQFPGVRSVDVKITEGSDRDYVLDSNRVVDATATVLLTMEQGKMLDEGQATAIRNYVSHSVAGLDPDNVSISDTLGRGYDTFSNGGNSTSDTALKLRTEQAIANRIITQVENILQDVGEGNLRVAANVKVELGDKTVNKHEVTLPDFAGNGETGGRGIIGSEYWTYQFVTPDGYSTGGVVGTPSNAELPINVEPGTTDAEIQGILQEEANRIYDNTTTDTEMIIRCATVTDATVSITINSNAFTDGYTLDEAQVRNAAAMAAGIIPVVTEEMTADEYLQTRISVLSYPFPRPDEPDEPPVNPPGTILGLPYWVFIAAGAGLLLFAIILTVILLLRRKKRKKQQEEEKAVEELLATAMPGATVEIGEDGQPVVVPPQLDEDGNPVAGANVMDLHTERSMELRQNIRDYVDENMEVAALLIKSWLKEDGDNG